MKADWAKGIARGLGAWGNLISDKNNIETYDTRNIEFYERVD